MSVLNNLGTNVFIYNGQKYLLSISLFVKSSRFQSMHLLNTPDIISFEYVTEANLLYIPATIVYIDQKGIIDKYFDKTYPYCEVLFSEIYQKEDNRVIKEELDQKCFFLHRFFVTKIEILDRKSRTITYRISMNSVNWFKLMSNITYSNYGQNPMSIIDIIKAIFSEAKLVIDSKNFDKITTDVKMNYITNGNDTVISSVKYLLSKLYYYLQKDPTWKFLYYDDIKDLYKIFDVKTRDTYNGGMIPLVISLFDSLNESMMLCEEMLLGSITRTSQEVLHLSMYNYEMTDYDFQHNIFVDRSIDTKDITRFWNERLPGSAYQDKFDAMFTSITPMIHRGTYWNDDQFINLYSNTFKLFNYNNTLVLNTVGKIDRRPTDWINLNIDRNLYKNPNDNVQNLDDLKKRYRAIEGHWIILKALHLIEPLKSRYRTNLVVYRNFILDSIDKKAKL